MSGSGGYFKYRCKYWLTYNCPNWVWFNNTPCANCLVSLQFSFQEHRADVVQSEGRDSDTAMMSTPFHISREVFAPQIENGSLHYIVMEIVAASDTGSAWAVKEVPVQPFPTATGPSAISITALDGIDPQKLSVGGLQAQ